MRTGDLNGDGNVDVMTGGPGYQFNPGSTARTHLGNGTGGFGNPNDLGFYVTDFGLADMNGDGNVDLIAVEVPGLTIRPGNGLGGFGAPVRLVTSPAAPISRSAISTWMAPSTSSRRRPRSPSSR